jgi:tRNA-dihydrouridine synthase A
MQDAVSIPVTVKHRIGINGRDSYAELCDFVGTVAAAGCRSFTVHARIAILEGLSPKENREVPPLRYEVAAQLTQDFPDLEFILNGGIKTLDECRTHLQTFDGVMLGREAYHNPYVLALVDQQLFASTAPVIGRAEALQLAPSASGRGWRDAPHHPPYSAWARFPAPGTRQLLSVDVHKVDDPLQLLDQATQLRGPLGLFRFIIGRARAVCASQEREACCYSNERRATHLKRQPAVARNIYCCCRTSRE